MRTHERTTAPLTVLIFLATMLAAQLLLITSAGNADASPAPPTAENFARLRACESGDNYSRAGRYYGAYQFSATTWRSLGYDGLPHVAPPKVQDEAASRLQGKAGWQQWPGCSRRLGLR